MISILVVVFFFQAEDGIRAPLVTGVRLVLSRSEGQPITEPDKGGFLVIKQPFPHFFRTVYSDPERYAKAWNTRSEERRVGKECRSRWSAYP